MHGPTGCIARASGTLAQKLDAVPRRKDRMLAEFWHKGPSPQGTLA
ncbi:MAG: hypothetical protein HFJ68_10860 [Adlercreutzia caecimuris]|nr:hypothetical protein [Adlercreutzia caecimuris]MCI9209012.1 hypothetical protein [Adlercreutzia caecimuris]